MLIMLLYVEYKCRCDSSVHMDCVGFVRIGVLANDDDEKVEEGDD